MSKGPQKIRLDTLLVEKGISKSVEEAQAFILAGYIWRSGGERLDKAGSKYPTDTAIEFKGKKGKFISRGGDKLEHALDVFKVNVQEKVCMDIGSSTGGFTDCLLKRGARHVFAVDVGYGQLDSTLRSYDRVSVLEKTNARHLTQAKILSVEPKQPKIELLVTDVSFISLKTVIEPLRKEFPWIQEWILLFKPQFEVGPQNLEKGGIVKNDAITHDVLKEFDEWMQKIGFKLKGGPLLSPVTGRRSGNKEYLFYYVV